MAGRGKKTAQLMIVGQNPGRTEDRTGEPFVGDSGTMLNRLVRLIPEDIGVYVTNSVKCYTPENRKPSLTEQESCRTYMMQEIASIQPLAIMALGNEALTSLTGQGGVSRKINVPTDLRASIRSHLLSLGITPPKVLATWHPAYILRDRNHYGEFEESFGAITRYIRQLRGEDQGQAVQWIEFGHKDEILSLVTAETNFTLSYDIETNALPFNDANFKMHMIGISNGVSAVVARREGHIQYAIEVLKTSGAKLVGYNSVSFDDNATGLESYDTIYLDYLIDEGVSSYDGRQKGRHKLQSSVVRHLQIPPWKDEVVWDWNTFDVFSPLWPTAALYNARDAVYTAKDYNVLYSRLTEKQKLLVEYIMQPAGRLLAKIEQRGVPISQENLDAVRLEIEVAREKALDKLVRKAFEFDLWTFNPNSHPQVRELLFDKMRLKPVNYTEGGEPSTDEETIRSLILSNGESESTLATLNSLLDFRGESKGYSFLKKCIPEQDGRIRSGYSLTQTVTGRTAGFGWHVQRMPRDKRFRRVVAAPPGMKLISADLSQIEMRTMAFLSREPNMLSVYKENLYGGDLHSFMAEHIARARGKTEWTAEDRQVAKPANFALLYGAEWFTVQSYLLEEYGLRLSQAEVKFIRNEVFFGTAFPTLPQYYNKVIRQVMQDGVVEGTFGLRRQLPNIKSRNPALQAAAAREAINTDNQGLASYIALIGCSLTDQIAGYFIEQVAFIHDAMLALVENSAVEDAKAIITDVFETQVRRYVLGHFNIDFDVPIKIDIKISDVWGE